MPNALVRTPVTLWTAGSTILPSEFTALERQIAQSWNGVDGGCWAPTSPIILNGSAGIAITGPLTITRGGLLTIYNAGTIQIANGDNIRYSPARSLTRQFACLTARPKHRIAWHARREDSGLQAWAPSYDLSDGTGQQVARAYLSFAAHDGSTVTQAVVSFRVGYTHGSLPGTMPSARILRVDAAGNAVPMTSTAAGGDASGYVYAAKPSSLASYAAGSAQTITLTCDQNNTVNRALYEYVVELVEEQGLTGYPWQLTFKQPVDVAAVGYQVASGLSATIDGVAVSNAGTRVLLGQQYDPSENGIFISSTGQWSRAPDFQSATDFSTGVIVPVNGGATQAGALMQVATGPTPAFVNGWGATTLYTVAGAIIQPSAAKATGYYYVATTGTTSSTEPTWPTSIGGTVVDGTVTWTCVAKIPTVPGATTWTPGNQPQAVSTWVSGQIVGSNLVRPTLLHYTGYFYKGGGSGTAGGTEPNWPTNIGDTVTDGSGTWTCTGKLPGQIAFLTKPDVANPVEGTGLIAHGVVWQTAAVTFSSISDARPQ